MISVIVVFPKLEEAKSIKNLLVRNGIEEVSVCTTGTQVINLVGSLDCGLIVSGYRFSDMLYSELLEYLPDTFDMLLLASKRYYAECSGNDIMTLSMPVKSADLVSTVNLMYDKLYYQMKKRKAKPAVRSEEEKKTIVNAKLMLMERKGMTEEEAHRYLQKKSMDSGSSLVETAHKMMAVL